MACEKIRHRVNGETRKTTVAQGHEGPMLCRIATRLRAKTYQFQTVCRVDMPQRKGTTSSRDGDASRQAVDADSAPGTDFAHELSNDPGSLSRINLFFTVRSP